MHCNNIVKVYAGHIHTAVNRMHGASNAPNALVVAQKLVFSGGQ